MKKKKASDLGDYIYIRLGKDVKKRIKERAKQDGSNMTIWVRQLIMRELNDDRG